MINFVLRTTFFIIGEWLLNKFPTYINRQHVNIVTIF